MLLVRTLHLLHVIILLVALIDKGNVRIYGRYSVIRSRRDAKFFSPKKILCMLTGKQGSCMPHTYQPLTGEKISIDDFLQ